MVVEEISSEAASDMQEPLEEIKEGVEKLQGITEHMSDDVKESTEVQKEIVEAAEKVEPVMPVVPSQDYSQPSYPSQSSKGTNPLVIIVPGFLLLGILLGGIVFYQKNISQQPTPVPTPTDNPITAVTPTATPATTTVDLTKFTVNIFNGSGIPGEAGKAKSLLTTNGFKVGTTGNATTFDFTKTVIKAKATVDAAFVTKLSTTLGKTYVVDAAQTLSATAKDGVEVTIGSSKAN